MRGAVRFDLADPGTLDEDEVRALWRLRTSLLRLKPEVDPERDFANFRRFVDAAWVTRVLDRDDRPRVMLCHQRFDGELDGQRYRLALFEYGFNDASLRGHPSVAFAFGQALLACRSWRPGVRDYFVGVGYPRSAVLVTRAVPDLRLSFDPSLDPLERHLVRRAIEQLGPDKFDERGVAEFPTLPDPICPRWRAKHADVPILRAFEAEVPNWMEGRGATLIGRLDGTMLAFARELGRRMTTRPRAPIRTARP